MLSTSVKNTRFNLIKENIRAQKKMILRSELIIVIIALLIPKSFLIPNIPCPSKFQYATSGDKNYGLITIDRVNYGETVVEIEISQPGSINADYSGNINLNFDKQKIFDYIKSGSPVTYRVDFPLKDVVPQVSAIRLNGETICSGSKVLAPSTSVTLKHTLTTSGASNAAASAPVSAPSQSPRIPIIWSDPSRNLPWLQISTTTSRPHFGYPNFLRSSSLSRPKETFSHDTSNPFFNTNNQFNYVFTIPATTSTTTEKPIYSRENPPSFIQVFRTMPSFVTLPPSTTEPTTTTTTTTTSTTTTTTTPRPTLPPPQSQQPALFIPRSSLSPTHEYINSVCGRENFGVKKLAVHGDIVSRARFPWIVALFKKNVGTLSFQCGGSLITTRTVISAAHCFYSGFDEIRDEDILVSMGRHNLTDWSDSYIVHSDVELVIPHPDYRPELENIDADLAIVRLKKTVQFSHAIRPVCMWEGPLDVHDIEGISGIVVGWGRDENNNDVTTSPRLVTASIASEITCIRSNHKLFYLTSNRTLCAGNRDGTGPCNGDSGSGLMIKNRNKWMLRGTVSAALGSEINQCNLDDYVVYTDIAKFIGWIHANMVL